MQYRASRFRLAFAACCLGALIAQQASGCMSYDEGLQGEIELSTQVWDWRDEVIYQVLVDRFADGDEGNNYGVDRTAMG